MKNSQNKFADSTLTIDLNAIAHNYNVLAKKSDKAECAAVVKANAYGLGVAKVAAKLQAQGCKSFFVATLDEGIELRKILGDEVKIFVFHGVQKSQEKEFEKNFLIPVLNDFYQVEIWNNYGRKQSTQLPAILHFDTGMNRLGINYHEAEKLEDYDTDNIRIDYIMSHLASISTPQDELNKLQLQRINKLRKLFPQAQVSFANSGGILTAKCYHFGLARAGSALYGIKGCQKVDLQNVITLKSKIIQIREIAESGTVGYNGTAKVKKSMRIAVVPAGYADGFLRSLSNNSFAVFNGQKLPLLGKISMDMMIFDITSLFSGKAAQIKIGDELELVGKNYTVDKIAKNAGTIGYEILTSLGARYKREYIS
jgi:alanine racemase